MPQLSRNGPSTSNKLASSSQTAKKNQRRNSVIVNTATVGKENALSPTSRTYSLRELNHWYFLQDHSLSDHPYILFDLAKTLQSPITSRKSKPPRADDIDAGLFNKNLADELEALDNIHKALSANDIDSYTKNVTSIIISSASRSKK
ncbi:hypothetical protein DAPPUDRAFT_263904 [Daphnia pulex]|uniref:Uncharacterized protein n=1 Tax=Daphnia pulex TaxID=6669 RepID=E9HQL3_DAPPU|nr:hypothetical protein DAPPUDRAFT_263904 [Daphnia pulex]|eukprot:EFX65967.1 hypothetical protein DAPPUDRAFT_263904 [Daphnia pulex]